MNSLRGGKAIRVVSDQWRTPTYVGDLAAGLRTLAECDETGVYHLSGDEGLTVFEFAQRIAASFGLDADRIAPVTSAELAEEGRRPPRTGFVIDKARQDIGYAPLDIDRGLAALEADLSANVPRERP